MEEEHDADHDTHDLPLCANINQILVRHFALDLTVHFDRKVISGSVVVFLEPRSRKGGNDRGTDEGAEEEAERREESLWEIIDNRAGPERQDRSGAEDDEPGGRKEPENADFILVLDCCDLSVSKVEAVDILSALSSHPAETSSDHSRTSLIENLISTPSTRWREQHRLFWLCSRAPADSPLCFRTDRWSLRVRKPGVSSPREFPRVLRIFYETRPTGGSVSWTKDQDGRDCVYTAGSPINNRALFPCQEPPVAMSTWQAAVRAPGECVVLMSGEEQVLPAEDAESRFSIWKYYVTMPMPASTFALAVGHWRRVIAEIPPAVEGGGDGTDRGGRAKLGSGSRTDGGLVSSPGCSAPGVVKVSMLQTGRGDQTSCSDSAFWYSSLQDESFSVSDYSGMVDDGIACSHGDYPCRFTERPARSQRVIPHRVFAPISLLRRAQVSVLRLLPRCLEAAHALLGTHPFSRLDVLIVPAGFSSLGMASPHIMFLSQSLLTPGSRRSEEQGLCLSGSRLCHEIAHSWFGLLIGARDWSEEWISEGFATYLEDVIWARAQRLSSQESTERSDLKALLRWRRLSDELQNSGEELQILRPNMEKTGEVSESGSSSVKHALNPEKAFLQVHYLKGYFLLKYLAGHVGERRFVDFFRLFVKKYHGQLILSQDFLRTLLITIPDAERKGLTLGAIYADWLDQPGIPKWLDEKSTLWSKAKLVEEVKAEVVKWIPLGRSHRRKGGKRKRAQPKVNYKEVTSDQLVLLLELLLEEADLAASALHALDRTYDLRNRDPEVRHRWCELVVKHAHTHAYDQVEHFLLHDQAMGVYLYGELMISEDPERQALARRCLATVREEMDQSARRVVEEMVL